MDDVQLELARQRIAECARVTACGLDTDKNFAVLKRKHVSGSHLSEKLPVQNRHPPIGNEPHKDLAQLTQVTSFSLSQLQATLHGSLCKCFKVTNIDADFSLKIPHTDARSARIAHRIIANYHQTISLVPAFLIRSTLLSKWRRHFCPGRRLELEHGRRNRSARLV